jgi:nicotinate-nucleotide adenylyltransferase
VAQTNLASIALFGGSFNPVHNGHLRLAVEMWESLRPDRLDFIPTANPPHKPNASLLPFELRVELLRAACTAFPAFHISTLEAERPEPSYTAVTLARYRELYPRAELYFMMGSEDFAGLATWKDWQRLPELANLLILPRQGIEEADFSAAVRRFWPRAEPCAAGPGWAFTAARVCFKVNDADRAGRLLYLPLPRLDINASMLRRRWLEGRRLDFWTPPAVLDALVAHRELVGQSWR